jgi:hypothetical protein
MTHINWEDSKGQPVHPTMENPQSFFWAKRCKDCGFTTEFRLPGSNESLSATRNEQRRHEEGAS